MSREKVKEIVDYMVSEGTQNTNYGSWSFDIPELCDKFDLPLEWFYEHNDDWNNHPLNYDLVYYTDFCHFEEV